MKIIFTFCLSFIIVGCATTKEVSKQRSYRLVNETTTSFDVLELVESYVNSIASYDWQNGIEVALQECEANENCTYSISHFANGCLFSSNIVGKGLNGKLTFTVTKYKPSLCE